MIADGCNRRNHRHYIFVLEPAKIIFKIELRVLGKDFLCGEEILSSDLLVL